MLTFVGGEVTIKKVVRFLLITSLSIFQEACCAYVLMVTAVYWVSEAVPLGAAALVPAFLYPLFGVLKSSEVSRNVL